MWDEEQLQSALRRWEQDLVADGRTRGTVATYVRDARAFISYLVGHSGGRRPDTGAARPLTTAARVERHPATRLIPAPTDLVQLGREWRLAGSPAQRGIKWPRERWVAAFPEHASVLRDLPQRLDRSAVRIVAQNAAESPQSAVEAFLVTCCWGFGTVGYGPHRVRRILEGTRGAAERLHVVAQSLATNGPVSAYGHLAGDCRLVQLGPAFGTKFLTFCQPGQQQPTALIHDDLVSSWLARHGRPDLGSVAWSEAVYDAYLAQMHAWAGELGLSAEAVEYVVFQAEADQRGNQWSG